MLPQDINASVASKIYYLVWLIEDPDMKIIRYHISFFLKNCYGRLKLMTCSYTCRELIPYKKITLRKKDGRWSHQMV